MSAQPQFNTGGKSPHLGSVDPLWVLWHAMGEPQPESARMDKTGPCARCGAFSERASRIKVVVSDKFTGWEDYTQSWDPLWCAPCAWGHTAPEVRTRAWRIGGSRVVEATSTLLGEELAAPLPMNVAIVVPLSRHKHILPSAMWGHVTTDDRILAWTSDEAQRFRTVQWLRGLGFNEAALGQPTPRFEQFATLDAPMMNLVLTRWADLSAWRADPAYLKVACVVSRPSKGAAA